MIESDSKAVGNSPGRRPHATCSRVVLVIAVVLLAAAAPGGWLLWLRATRQGGEARHVGALRTVNSAQTLYYYRNDVQRYASSLAELHAAGLVSDELGSGSLSGFRFELRTSGLYWLCVCNPEPGTENDRGFCIDQSGIVYAGPAPLVAANPPGLPAGVRPLGK